MWGLQIGTDVIDVSNSRADLIPSKMSPCPQSSDLNPVDSRHYPWVHVSPVHNITILALWYYRAADQLVEQKFAVWALLHWAIMTFTFWDIGPKTMMQKRMWQSFLNCHAMTSLVVSASSLRMTTSKDSTSAPCPQICLPSHKKILKQCTCVQLVSTWLCSRKFT